jgi:hypothetical protein
MFSIVAQLCEMKIERRDDCCRCTSTKAGASKYKKPHEAAFCIVSTLPNRQLALRELLATTCFVQTNFFTFNFASVTRHEAGF